MPSVRTLTLSDFNSIFYRIAQKQQPHTRIMTHFNVGDRVRVDLYEYDSSFESQEDLHGRFCTITKVGQTNSGIQVEFDDGHTETIPEIALQPAPSLTPLLSIREYDTATNIWGDNLTKDLRDLSTDQLWKMKRRVSEAVQLSYDDDDMESMGVLCPLEAKISQVLSERV